MSVVADQRLKDVVAEHPYPLLFATVSGAHLYGFTDADLDRDRAQLECLARGGEVLESLLQPHKHVVLDPGRLVLRLLEHAPIEFEQAKLSIDIGISDG